MPRTASPAHLSNLIDKDAVMGECVALFATRSPIPNLSETFDVNAIHKFDIPEVDISPVSDIVAELRAGNMVVLVDDEDRENEGDLVIAADHVSAAAINFMARYARGLICLTLPRETCERLHLPPMARKNGSSHGTAFTVSIEAAQGVTTGISAADRARTVQAAVALQAQATDLVQPGHIFPLQAVDGGVLMRAGHTEAGCDLARMAGCSPTSVICEIMNDDGTMARMPDLRKFAAQHGLKIGTIADLIEHRVQHESLITRTATRVLETQWGSFTAHLYQDEPSHNVHLALVHGAWQEDEVIPVRVHEPLSVVDILEINHHPHFRGLAQSLTRIVDEGRGVAVLLNCGDATQHLLAQFEGTSPASNSHRRDGMDMRTYGIGAQILRSCNVKKIALMGTQRRLPSLAGHGLQIVSFIDANLD